LKFLRFVLVALSLGTAPLPAIAETVDGRRIVIIDGDTIDVRGERIRILNIDARRAFARDARPN
jgi:endonuclease YncB( thermonuclease family)